MLREKLKGKQPRGESTDALAWGGPVRSSDEGLVMGLRQFRKAIQDRQFRTDETTPTLHSDRDETWTGRLLARHTCNRKGYVPLSRDFSRFLVWNIYSDDSSQTCHDENLVAHLTTFVERCPQSFARCPFLTTSSPWSLNSR